MSLSPTRSGANATPLPEPTPLPPLAAALSRRAALFGAVTVAGVTAAAAVPAVADILVSSPEADLFARAAALKALRARELQAWRSLTDDASDDGPESAACSALSSDVCAAGEALAEVAAVTPGGLAAKASATLALVGSGVWATQEAFTEHHALVASVLRDAAGEREAPRPIAAAPSSTSADGHLALMADQIDAMQAKADRLAAAAEIDPNDPYTLTVAEIDRIAAEMAALPADTMGGVMTKVRAMATPIVREDGDSPLPLSVCRDLRRLHASGALS